MRVVRPAHGVRFIEAIRPAPIQLTAGASEQVVDAVVTGMLEVVLMAGEHNAYAGTCEERQQRVHPVGVVMIWPRTERRVVTENEFPARRRVRHQRLLHPFPVLRIFKQTLALEEILLGRVDADELDIASITESIEESRIHRRTSGCLVARGALAQIEVVEHLLTVVSI